jgi:prepilin-type N-terminal cleavage/methylation domain-containing protein
MLRMDTSYTPPRSSSSKGFTFLEISIVLVLIGMVVGIVVTGKGVIMSGKVRSTIADVARIKAAINAFESKYDCLPGDCAFATTIGGTTNGDGDGYIDSSSEPRYLYNHLGAVGMLPKTYANNEYVTTALGANTNLVYSGGANRTASYAITIGNTTLGAVAVSLTASEALLLDRKADDGNPSRGGMTSAGAGNLRSLASSSTVTPGNAACSVSSGNGYYNVSYTSAACAMEWLDN